MAQLEDEGRLAPKVLLDPKDSKEHVVSLEILAHLGHREVLALVVFLDLLAKMVCLETMDYLALLAHPVQLEAVDCPACLVFLAQRDTVDSLVWMEQRENKAPWEKRDPPDPQERWDLKDQWALLDLEESAVVMDHLGPLVFEDWME